MRTCVLTAAFAASVSPAVQAGVFLIGIADPAQETSVWAIDEFTGAATPLFGGYEVQGLATDDAGGELFFTDGTRIYSWDYSGTQPPEMVFDLGLLTLPGGGVPDDLMLTGLAFTDSGGPDGRLLIATGLSQEIVTTFSLAIDAADGDLLAGMSQGPAEAFAITSLDLLTQGGVATQGAAFAVDLPESQLGVSLFDPSLGLPMTGADLLEGYPISEVALSSEALFVAPLQSSALGENILVFRNGGSDVSTLPIPYEFTDTLFGGGGAYSIVPAPGAVAGFGIVGLAALRRRRG